MPGNLPALLYVKMFGYIIDCRFCMSSLPGSPASSASRRWHVWYILTHRRYNSLARLVRIVFHEIGRRLHETLADLTAAQSVNVAGTDARICFTVGITIHLRVTLTCHEWFTLKMAVKTHRVILIHIQPVHTPHHCRRVPSRPSAKQPVLLRRFY